MKKKLLISLSMLFYTLPVFAVNVANASKNACGVVAEYSKKAAEIIMIAAPILLVILATVDILKAVSASDEKAMAKCFSTIIKRVIICLIILILPIIVNFIIGWTTFNNLTSCW